MQEVPQKQPLSVIGPPFLPLSKISVVPGFHGYEDPEAIFELTRRIGKGGFGEVYKATWKPQNKEVALKIMEIENDVDANSVAEEIKLIKSCDSNHVVKYYGSYFKYDKLWISIEYCDAGSCLDVIRRMRRPFTEKEIRCTMRQVVQGLNYIHSRVPQICHRDIKAGNILLNSRGEAKLADFGISAQITATMKKLNTQIGSPYWMAPEVLSDERYDTKVDIWALGVTCIELAQGKPPWYDQGALRALFLISTKPPPTLTQPEMWSAEFNQFLECSLMRDQSKRLSTGELLQLPFLRDCTDSSALNKLIQDAIKAAAAEAELEVLERNEASDEDSSEEQTAGKHSEPVAMSWMSFLTESRHTAPPPLPPLEKSNRKKGTKKKPSSSKKDKKDKEKKGLLFWRSGSSGASASGSPPATSASSPPTGPSASAATSAGGIPASASAPVVASQKSTPTPARHSPNGSSSGSAIGTMASASGASIGSPNINKTRQQPIHVAPPVPPTPTSSAVPSAVQPSAAIVPPLSTSTASTASSTSASAASTERSSNPIRSRWYEFFTTNCGLSEEDARSYVLLFRNNEIEEDQILDVTEQILKEIGVKVGHALRIMKQVNMLRAQAVV